MMAPQQVSSAAGARAVPGAALDFVGAFEAQARRTPDAIAVVCGMERLTYRALNGRANAVAARLRSAGHGRGSYVGISFERSPEMMVALWGVVKSGAAYIPVDPTYPEARLAHMAASARWSTLLTSSALAARFQNVTEGGPVLVAQRVDGDEATPDPEPAAGSQDPLYAIFTSGSTGQPKAASVFRSGFANLLRWYGEAFQLDASCRALVLTSLSFDLTQKNLFAPLLAGGAVILQPPGPYDLPAIESQMTTHGITLFNATPSAFYPLVDATASRGFAPLASLRAAVLGGEPISVPRLRAWLEAPVTQACVANTYGPTECTDICAWHRMDRRNMDAWPFVPLGREIPGVGIIIVDGQLQPVPDGGQGELCITGAGVGGGYLHDPARTAERFVPNPWPDRVPGPTLYRTGDLARRGPDGVLEFRGRMDHQVKVRGFRIELGEIEQALATHPSVREAVVTAAHGGDEGAGLTAWLLARTVPAEPAALRSHLAARLPTHMIPEEVRWLDAYPLTPNGKVDRRALEAGGCAPETAVAPAPAPARTEWESRLLAIWSELLGRPVTDTSATFFELGGNSLQLAVLHARLGESTGRAFPITELFTHPTVRSLAVFLGGGADAANRPSIAERARQQQARFTQLRRSPPRP